MSDEQILADQHIPPSAHTIFSNVVHAANSLTSDASLDNQQQTPQRSIGRTLFTSRDDISAAGDDAQTAIIEVADLVKDIPASNPYFILKARLIQRFADSPERKIDKALNHLELGDGKPSQLYRKMMQLVGDNATDDLLRVKWPNLLPSQTRQILRIFKTQNVDELFQAADAMLESPMLPSTAAIAAPDINAIQQRTSDLVNLKLLMAQIITLCRNIHTCVSRPPRTQHINDNRGNNHRSNANNSRRERSSSSSSGRQHFRGVSPAKPPHTAFFNADRPASDPWTETRLHVFDKNTGTRFLVESGSVVSILPCSAATARSSSHPNLSAANGSIIKCRGRRLAQLDMGLRRNFVWSFVLADISTPIIGIDFLSHFGLLPDLKRKRLIDEIASCSVNGLLAPTQTHSISALSPPPGLFEGLLHTGQRPCPPVLHTKLPGSRPGSPVHCKPCQLLNPKLKIAKAEYQALLQLGIIRPSSSPYASPLHMATFKSGKLRPTGDYRALNAQTLPDRYPFPRIVDLLRQPHGCNRFSVIDLCKAFFQIPVAENDIQKTAVTTPFGLFEFLDMPLGLRNATQTFMRYMHSILGHLDFVHVYLDDFLIASNDEQQYLEHLPTVFSTLLKSKVKINWNKCQFCKQQVTFLEHTVHSKGFSVPPDRAQAMTEYPTPTTVYDLRRFLGAVNYFRTLIPHAAHAQAELHDLIKGNKKTDKT
ncbi:uncharacterized protein [Neodiprion pinetum]|uniref:uncharacterized protein n=1 Tax=Neodiprion pinetum TaxID=441929 RepID=UPI00371025A8